jgi:hypothetical protein
MEGGTMLKKDIWWISLPELFYILRECDCTCVHGLTSMVTGEPVKCRRCTLMDEAAEIVRNWDKDEEKAVENGA